VGRLLTRLLRELGLLDLVLEHLPFSVRTAERLMAIARNPVLTKSESDQDRAYSLARA
jgi:hypothetical protein